MDAKVVDQRKRRHEQYLRNKDRYLFRIKRWKDNNPWIVSYNKAHQRCNNEKCNAYKKYGGNGIKLLMSLNDFWFLWTRDNANKMDRPSIDRIDPDGNYELTNCRFIELKENMKRARTSHKVVAIDCEGNKLDFHSVKEASRFLNMSYIGHIFRKSNKNVLYKGYLWSKV